ncbi:DUF1642 domain-containing protein [Lactococcus taiwanensis]|uniref:DUF1642 domain-containing protein n=1 Tax=Lactococcus taiwanensis TaxID=1151742 RepID=UPI001966571B|nr:DUF1642 domain-containing protein [Lactococcus taiwanensis]QRZ11746.1 DUF1642 domain-containing protein [Lactococcus taiwanensis]
MTKTFEEVPVATVEVIPTFDGNEIKFKPLSKLENYLIAEGEVELYLRTQHQPLPEVPECVAEGIESIPRYYSAFGAMLLVKNKFEKRPEDNEDWMYLYNWLFDLENEKNNQDLFVRAWLDGYTVQKPKRFYLKHIDMSKADKELDYYLAKEDDGTLSHDMPNKGQFPWHPESRFTQKEIDSMQTGSYEKIEVEK